MTRSRPILAALVAASFVVGAPNLASAQDLRMALSSEPSAMDPHFHNLDAEQRAELARISTASCSSTRSTSRMPGLATSWKTIDDKTWEFKLRTGVKWHDGSPFTADDVIFTMERAPNVENSPGSFALYVRGKTFTKVDDLTVRVTTKAPYPLMPNDMATIAIVSKKVGDRRQDRGLQQRQGGDRHRPLQVLRVRQGRPLRPRAQRRLLGRQAEMGKGHDPADQDRAGARRGPACGRCRRDRGSADHRHPAPPEGRQGRGRAGPLQPRHLSSTWISGGTRRRSSRPTTARRSRIRSRTCACGKALSKAINRTAIVDRLMEKAAVPAASSSPTASSASRRS